MSRYKVEHQKILGKGQKGTIRWELNATNKALSFFSVGERNAIVRESMRKGGRFWIDIFLPQRFSTYAKTLGYWVSTKYLKAKRRLTGMADPTPLVYTGTLQSVALGGANAKATATQTKTHVAIKIPTGHAIAPIVTKVLRTLPAHEIARVATVVGQSIVAIINGADEADNYSSAKRTRLSIPQRRALGIKPRVTYGTKAKTGAD